MGDSEPSSPPPLGEAARSVYDAARAFAGVGGSAATTLRRLLLADLALARTAATQGALLFAAAAVLAFTGWVLLTALAVWGLHAAGLGWGTALALPALADLALAALLAWRALAVLRLADLQTTRQQLASLVGDARTLVAAGLARADVAAEPDP